MGRYVRNELIEQGNNTRRNMYSFIIEFITTHGYSPSFKEIADGTGIKSMSTIKRQLYVLERLGKIHTQGFKPRTISLVGFEFRRKTEGSVNGKG